MFPQFEVFDVNQSVIVKLNVNQHKTKITKENS